MDQSHVQIGQRDSRIKIATATISCYIMGRNGYKMKGARIDSASKVRDDG